MLNSSELAESFHADCSRQNYNPMATDVVAEEKSSTDAEYTTAELAPSEAEHDHWDPLAWPESTVNPTQVRWRYAIGIPGVHLLACLAFFPWFFSWTGVVLSILGLYVFGTLGINLCYHRLLTHQGLTCPKWLEHAFAVLGVCTMQDTPACWVAMHRIHHKYSDHRPDPHSPLVNFLWGHCGWLMFQNREFTNVNYYQRFTRDILRDPFYMKLGKERELAEDLSGLDVRLFLGWLSDWLANGWHTHARSAVRLEPDGLGCVCANCAHLAHYLERQLVHARVGLSELRDRRQQSQ